MISGNLRQLFLDEKTRMKMPKRLYYFIILYDLLRLKCNPNPLKTAQNPHKTRVYVKRVLFISYMFLHPKCAFPLFTTHTKVTFIRIKSSIPSKTQTWNVYFCSCFTVQSGYAFYTQITKSATSQPRRPLFYTTKHGQKCQNGWSVKANFINFIWVVTSKVQSGLRPNPLKTPKKYVWNMHLASYK